MIPLERLGLGAPDPGGAAPVVRSTDRTLEDPIASFVAIEPFEVRHEVLLGPSGIAALGGAVLSRTTSQGSSREWRSSGISPFISDSR